MGKIQFERPEGSRVGVWVNQDMDTGHGLQVEICPKVFLLAENGLLYTHIGRVIFGEYMDGMVPVPEEDETAVLEAATEDPCQATFLEFVHLNDQGQITAVWNGLQRAWKQWRVTTMPIENYDSLVLPEHQPTLPV